MTTSDRFEECLSDVMDAMQDVAFMQPDHAEDDDGNPTVGYADVQAAYEALDCATSVEKPADLVANLQLALAALKRLPRGFDGAQQARREVAAILAAALDL